MKTTHWKILLQLKKAIRMFSGEVAFVFIDKEKVLINEIPSDYAEGSFIVSLQKGIEIT